MRISAVAAAGTADERAHLLRERVDELADEVLMDACHICTGTGLAPLPHLPRDWARRFHICPGTGLAPLPHLRTDGVGIPNPVVLRRDWA